eukprot:scaffold5412_cov45-Phaeocystis_antarctica.AAC.2
MKEAIASSTAIEAVAMSSRGEVAHLDTARGRVGVRVRLRLRAHLDTAARHSRPDAGHLVRVKVRDRVR